VTDQLRDDTSYMLEALALAARTPRRTWPNPPVGALVVRPDGRLVGRGAHHGPATSHAEAVALDEAGEQARGATLYCTLEPCNHHGRTPPCAPRVAASGVSRVVVGVKDPNPRVAGGGLRLIRDSGVNVALGVAAAECTELIWPFVATAAFARPFVLLKTATSIDGRFAPAASHGRAPAPLYLTGTEARRDVHRLRRWSDLVLVGAGTVLADRPALDGRLAAADDACPAADPRPGYVDTDLGVEIEWPGRCALAFGGCERADAARVRAIETRGITVVLCAERHGRVDPSSLLARLAGVGVYSVLLEGGPRLARSFLAQGLVDRWVSFVAPAVLGEGPGWPDAAPGADDQAPGWSRFALTRCTRVGADARLVYDRTPFDETVRRLTAATEA
jgi:diaminohydroxyphosphoribosylaminopyrimidine deaminase / 5-amino-6-(5-phosphoribosylamino)uracil reductase